MKQTIAILVFALFACVSCYKTPPQRPTYRNGQTITTQQDTALLGLIELNQRLTEEADRQLASLADSTMTLEDSGYWISGLHDIDNGLQDKQWIQVHLRLFDIADSTLLLDTQQNVQVGQWETAQALSSALPLLHIGDSATLLIPWYIGFGTTGNSYVKPYTNLRAELVLFSDEK